MSESIPKPELSQEDIRRLKELMYVSDEEETPSAEDVFAEIMRGVDEVRSSDPSWDKRTGPGITGGLDPRTDELENLYNKMI